MAVRTGTKWSAYIGQGIVVALLPLCEICYGSVVFTCGVYVAVAWNERHEQQIHA